MTQKILFFVYAASLSLSLQSAEIRKLTEEQQKKLTASCQQLPSLKWEERRPVLEKLIKEDHINPNAIHYCGINKTPLVDALENNDHPFVEFLLTSKANPNQAHTGGTHVLGCAPTVALATLMAKHGTRITADYIPYKSESDVEEMMSLNKSFHSIAPEDKERVKKLFINTASETCIMQSTLLAKSHEPELIPFYVKSGLDPAHINDRGETYLHQFIWQWGFYAKDGKNMANAVEKMKHLIKLGLPLHVKAGSDSYIPSMAKKTVPEWLAQQALDESDARKRESYAHLLTSLLRIVNDKKKEEEAKVA